MVNKLLLNLSGGMNSRAAPLIIKDSEAELVLNYHLDKLGAIKKRDGYATYANRYTSLITASTSGSVDWQYVGVSVSPSGTSLPAINGSVSSQTSGAGTSTTETMSHTVAAGLSNSLLVVFISNPQSAAPTGVTWNGVAMTQAVSLTANFFSQIWYLVAPAAATANIVGTWGVNVSERSLVAITLTGVNQTTPIYNSNSNSGSSAAASVSLSTKNNSLLIGGLMTQNTTITLSQTSRALLTTATNSFKVSVATSSSMSQVNGLYQFYDDANSALKQLMVANTLSGSAGAIWYNNSGTWTVAKANDTASKKSRFSTFINYVFRVNGTEVVASSTNGTTWGTTNAPATITPKYTAVFQDRSYMANGASSNKSRVWFSSLPSAGTITWTTASDYVDINPDDGDEITALENNGNRLLIFKSRSLYRWTFGQVEPDRLIGVGTRSQESVKTNFDIGVTFFSNPHGIYSYTTGRPKLISRKIQEYVDAVTDWTNVFGEVDDDHYYLFVGDLTVGSRTISNAMFVYHISLDAWVVYSLANPVTWMARLATTYGGTETVHFGSTDGRVYTFSSGTTDYFNEEEVPVKCEFISKEYMLSFPMRTNLNWIDIFATQRISSIASYDLDRLDSFGNNQLGNLTERITPFRVPVRECNSIRVKIADNSKNTSIVEGFNFEHEPKDKRDEVKNRIKSRRDV